MSFLKKLFGLAVFVAALAIAIGVTKFYSARQDRDENRNVSHSEDAPPPPPFPPHVVPDAPPPPDAPERRAAFSKAQLITLDREARKCHLTITIERDLESPAPERLWVWAYFFTPSARNAKASEHWSIEPQEVRRPFADGDRVVKNLTADCAWLAAPGVPAEGFYARLKLSTASKEAARVRPEEMSFDAAGATPVVVESGKRAKAR